MAKQKFYVVWEGVTPGVYTSWTDCQLQIKGYEGAKYKSFDTREEAERALATSPYAYIGKNAKKKSEKVSSETLPACVIDNSLAVDAACSGNPGPGGWGAILRFRTAQKVYEKELSGGEANTTNNRMEMTALLEALRQLKEPCAIDLYSDSKYVIDSLQKGWARGWRARGWKKADKSPALNPDLWAPLLAESEKHEITYHWLKGHAGHPENERCDRMAVEQSKKYGGRQA